MQNTKIPQNHAKPIEVHNDNVSYNKRVNLVYVLQL